MVAVLSRSWLQTQPVPPTKGRGADHRNESKAIYKLSMDVNHMHGSTTSAD